MKRTFARPVRPLPRTHLDPATARLELVLVDRQLAAAKAAAATTVKAVR